MFELQSQLDDDKASLEHSRQTLDQERRQLKEENQRFKAEEMARYENLIETERKRLKNESQKLIKQNEAATATELEQATQQIRKLESQVSGLTEAKEDTERTLTLFKACAKELEDQKRSLKPGTRLKTSHYQRCKKSLIRFLIWEWLTLLLARRTCPRYTKTSRQLHMPISENFHSRMS